MSSWSGLLFSVVIVLAFAQTVMWLNNRFVAPWLQRKLPSRQPFIGLMKAGFSFPSSSESWHETDETSTVVGLIGEVKGYSVEVSTNYVSGWWKTPFYLIRVFFNIDNLTNQQLQIRRQNNLDCSQYIRWNEQIKLTATHAEEKWVVSQYGPPRGEVVLTSIEHLVTELKKIGLKPVSYEEATVQWHRIKE